MSLITTRHNSQSQTNQNASSERVQPDYAAWYALMLAMMLGLYVRLLPVLWSDFPLNDGGLFYLMTQEVRNAHYRLPTYTSYNAAHIPFAYPPLAFYMAAALSDITGWSLLDVLRFLPALVSTLTIPAFYLLARALLRSWTPVIFATLAFALLPRTFGWRIMGGGLTRSPGFLFAILAVHQAYLLYTRREKRFIYTTAICAGLTLLTHAEMTLFAVYSLALLWLFYGRDRQGIKYSLLVIVGIVALSAPWWLTVISRHGLAPFLAAAQTGQGSWINQPLWMVALQLLGETRLPILALVSLLGIGYCLLKRQYFLLAWVAAIFIIHPRSARTFVMIPLCLFIGIGMANVVLPWLYKLGKQTLNQPIAGATPQPIAPGRTELIGQHATAVLTDPNRQRLMLTLGCFTLYVLLCGWITVTKSSQLRPIAAQERAAMQWMAMHTTPDSKVLVFPSALWAEDRSSEWFPVLAQRESIATVQGYEWLPGQFFHRWQRADALYDCMQQKVKNKAGDSTACLEPWQEPSGLTYSYVYISKLADEPVARKSSDYLTQRLRNAPGYNLVYDGVGAAIFAHKITQHRLVQQQGQRLNNTDKISTTHAR